MNFAFMTFSTPDLTFPECLEVAKEYGYEGLELRIDAGQKHGVEVASSPAEREGIRQASVDTAVALCCVSTSLKFADSDTDRTVADARERIALAGDVGAPCLRVFGGALPEGMERPAATEQVTAALLRVADEAAERGVTLCMETHDAWCDPADVAEVCRRADHPAVAVNWDVMHPVRTGHATIAESYETLRPWIRHVHVHDGVFDDGIRMVPIGEGEIDHRAVIDLLTKHNYFGYVSGEWINWEPYDVHLPRELKTLRGYEGDVGRGPVEVTERS